jgi:four helix bundle protein
MYSLEDLEVWKSARDFRKDVSDLSKTLPSREKFRLSDQIIRSSRSISANIAEGYGRYHYQENIQYCRIARGSLYETLDHIICAYDEKYIDEQKLKEFREKYDQLRLFSKVCHK